jgi:hypothetical protein
MIISVTPRSMLCRLLEMAASCVPINNICPMLEATFVHPEVCTIVETMLTELVGMPAYQHCRRDNSLACRFEVPSG